MQKRIVILSAFLSPLRSGAEACAEEVPLRLKDDFDFTIVTAKMRRDLPREDKLKGQIRVIRVGLGLGLDKWLYPFLAPLAVRKLKPDIIHAILETFAGLALKNCRFVSKAKRILTLQTTNRSFMKKGIVKSVDKVTAISSVLKKQAEEWRRDEVELIPNGIDTFAINQSRLQHQRIQGRILFVGRLEPQKGVDTLLEALSKLKDQKWELNVVGDGSQRKNLEKLAAELELADPKGVPSGDRVKFLGYIAPPNVYKEYAEAEIFCGPSRSEALGNVFLEAQAAGCATIGTHVGGIPDVLFHGTAGWLVEPDNVEELSGAISSYLNDDDLRKRHATKAQEHAKGFDWSNIAQKYKELYV